MLVHLSRFTSHWTASSSAEWILDKQSSSFVKGHESTMWDIIWILAIWARFRCHVFPLVPQWPAVQCGTVQQRQLLSSKVEARLSESWVIC